MFDTDLDDMIACYETSVAGLVNQLRKNFPEWERE